MPQTERHVRLFRNGRNQAVRIPREFELEGDEAIMRKEGSRLILEPVRKGRLLSLLATISPLDEPFPDVDKDLPPLDEAALWQSHFVICWIRTSFPIWFDNHKAW